MNLFCSKCNRCFSADDVAGKKEVKCPKCDSMVPIPESSTSPGAVFGDFIIKEKLSSGGMGDVFLVHQISLDRPAALKILKEELSNDQEYVDGIFMEARAAAKLNHPHIVQAYAVGEENGKKYFAMEYVKGETYKQILKDKGGKLDFNLAARVIMEIADALNFAWTEQKLVHQDIKPDNIMCAANGSSKLADLGLCRIAGKSSSSDNEDEVLGTPQYISPEQMTGVPTDVRSDIYSLGATFYHFVTGRFPYVADDANEIARMHVAGKLDHPRKVNPKVPEELNRIILKMMALRPEDRYQTPAPLMDDLRNFLDANKNPKALPKLSLNVPKPKVPQLKINVPRPAPAVPKAVPQPPAEEKKQPQPPPAVQSAEKPAEEKKPETKVETPAEEKERKPFFNQLWVKIVVAAVLLIMIAGGVLLILMKRNMLPESIAAFLKKPVAESAPVKRQTASKAKKTIKPVKQEIAKPVTRAAYVREIQRIMNLPTGTEAEQKDFLTKAGKVLFDVFAGRETPQTPEEWQAVRALQQKWAAFDEKLVFAAKRTKFLKQREAKIQSKLRAMAEAEEQKRLQEEKEKELKLKREAQEREHQKKIQLERQNVLKKQYELVLSQITPLNDKLISTFKESLAQNNETIFKNAVSEANQWKKPVNPGSAEEQKLINEFLTLRKQLPAELNKCLSLKNALSKITLTDNLTIGYNKNSYFTIVKIDPGKTVKVNYGDQENIDLPLTDNKVSKTYYQTLLRFCAGDKNLAKLLGVPFKSKKITQKQTDAMEFYCCLIGDNLNEAMLIKAPNAFWKNNGAKFLPKK